VLIFGIILALVGVSDLVIAALVTRKATAGSGGLGAEPPPLAGYLRRFGAMSIAVGLVLVAIGLAI
jgi:hypothetical protein